MFWNAQGGRDAEAEQLLAEVGAVSTSVSFK